MRRGSAAAATGGDWFTASAILAPGRDVSPRGAVAHRFLKSSDRMP